jgi:predicted GIY-YIG superfamily endonuclease
MSSLYFIQAKLTRRIKIGVAKNPEQRLRLHQEYGTERATGEWFEETERLLQEVAGLQAINTTRSCWRWSGWVGTKLGTVL